MSYIGTYEKTIYQNPEDGYCVICLSSSDDKIPEKYRYPQHSPDGKIRFIAKGYDLPLTNCIQLILDGSWESNSKHGCQYRIDLWEEVVPKTLEGIKKYLLSGIIKGIDWKAANAILNQFGTASLDILKEQPERLLTISCLGKKQVAMIIDSCHQKWKLKELTQFLEPYKINPKDAYRVFQTLGFDGLNQLQDNPFLLGTVPGFAFERVEAFARKINYDPHDPVRIKNAVTQILKNCQKDKGHLFLGVNDLYERSLKLLNERLPVNFRLQEREICDTVYDMVLSGDLVSCEGVLYLAKNFLSEDIAARYIAKLVKCNEKIDITKPLDSVIQNTGITLSTKQMEAVKAAFHNNISIITGAPGTGKTTVLKVILELYRLMKPDGKIIFAAPTGRASRRMAEATGFTEAQTLHMALGLFSAEEVNKHDLKEIIDADLIIVDETSMVDMGLAAELFSRIRDETRVLLVGDADQLPSVGAGNVFRELIDCNVIPVTTLTNIFRQSEDSMVFNNIKVINANQTALSFGPDFVMKECNTQKEAASIIQNIYKRLVDETGIDKVQILTPFREKGCASMKRLNHTVRDIVNPSAEGKPELKVGEEIYRLGDRVMQTVNNYSIPWELEDGTLCKGVFNGDTGTIESIDMASETMKINMDGRLVSYDTLTAKQLGLSFAITIHRAMGSEYDTVIIPLLLSHQRMLYRNLIYTAISRSKKRVFLVGQKDALAMAIHTINERNSYLGKRVKFYFKSFTQMNEAYPLLKKTA